MDLHRDISVQQVRSEKHTSELQSRETISYAVFCLKKKKKNTKKTHHEQTKKHVKPVSQQPP